MAAAVPETGNGPAYRAILPFNRTKKFSEIQDTDTTKFTGGNSEEIQDTHEFSRNPE